ncbi:hypothetical protein FOPG_15425 [Fusarium oxysporum f. sp. conglutinans race 2 54008]|uniref:Uncharacterized protein n=1 Tax=Fusarium oxysporum f. sp. conglutinans race 2 54008 TaxID=1089457 RepID=X0GYP8_FUSOX|nr:hypothetical protein FOPG_15425 [Fusarium oxysporum f. sp. conglutinans race 2 54008]
MGHSKKMVVSIFTSALLIPSLFKPYVTASYSHHHARPNQTDRDVGNEDLQVKSTGNMSDGRDFDLADLKRFFPEKHMPSDTSDPQYGLITFGASSESGVVDTASSGSGFLLAVGESHGLTQLQKRDGRPDPFVFLDCPANVLDQPINQTQKARVVCTSQDVEGCFRVRERGVEGTLVEMPEECAPNSFARAISLDLAEDQTMPDNLAKLHTPTSPIYEFSFDFNKHERRADAKVAIRMDMTNVKGYWDGLFDSPGVKKRDVERRYLSSLNVDWKTALQKHDKLQYGPDKNPLKVEKDLSTPVFWQAADSCPVGDKHQGEGIAAFIEGKVDASLSYAATVIATSTRGSRSVYITEVTGFINVTGQTNLTFGVGGMGRLDISRAGKGNPAKSEPFYKSFLKKTINAGSFWGYMCLTPFIKRQTWLATSQMDESPSSASNLAAPATLNGRLTTRVKTDLGEFPAAFPHILSPEEMDSLIKDHKETEMESFNDDILYGDGGEKGSTIQIGHNLAFGLSLSFGIFPDVQGQKPVHESDSAFVIATTIVTCYQRDICQVGYPTSRERPSLPSCISLVTTVEFPSPGNQSAAISTNVFNKRGFYNPKDTERLRPIDVLNFGAFLFLPRSPNRNFGKINCDNGRCGTCLDYKTSESCCGCVCMQCKYGPRGDMPPCKKCTDEGVEGEAKWPGPHVKRDRISGNDVPEDEGEGGAHDHMNDLHSRAPYIYTDWKSVKVCKEDYEYYNKKRSQQFKYPQFPKDVRKVWDGAVGGAYDSIYSYWGNRSADCADWSIARNATRDQTHIGNGVFVPSAYQTEHVYEGQNLGQFFTEWLTGGQIERQRPSPGTKTGKVDCVWIKKWIMERTGGKIPWRNPLNPGEAYSLFGTLWTELGNNYHQDRLAILQERLNRKKENLFDLSKSYSEKTYLGLSTDEQWMTVKEIGLTFSYMNNDTIWGMWCDTFVGVYDRLDDFDLWYTVNKGPNDPDVTLAEEWGRYNRIVLDSAVRIYRDGWDWTYNNRRRVNLLLKQDFGVVVA